MDIKERIIFYAKSMDMPISKFEKQCGMSNGYIKNFKGNLSAAKLEGILNSFPELSREWLLYGEGDMLKDSVVQTSRGNNSPNINGNGNHVQGTSALLDNALELQRAALTEISEMRKLLQEQVRNNQEQARSNREQFDRLTNIIESLTRKD